MERGRARVWGRIRRRKKENKIRSMIEEEAVKNKKE